MESSGFVLGTERIPRGCLNAIDRTVIQCAEFWADQCFNAPDGKKWRLLIDGETIFSRQQQEPLTASEREWLNKQDGAIVDVSTDEKPLYYTDPEALEGAWEELQRTYGIEAEEYFPD